MNGDQKLHFNLGRHGEKDTAAWFNKLFTAGQTTFNDHAGKLNFAFIGTLELKLAGSDLPGNEETFTFENTGIAQGHTGASNNWWFAGYQASHLNDIAIARPSTGSKGTQAEIQFLRGPSYGTKISYTVKVDTRA